MTTANHNRTKAQPKITKAIKKALVDRDLSITELARRLGKSRNGVSIAINHPSMFPGIQELVRKELAL